jgi:hypothetical protein
MSNIKKTRKPTTKRPAGAYIWLQDDESEGVADCGCRLIRSYQGSGPAVILCLAHAALNVEPAKPLPVRKTKAVKAAAVVSGASAIACITLGGYGHEHAALADCAEFKQPTVFSYRSAIFPSPTDFGVDVKITDARAVKLEQPPSPLYPWGVQLDIVVRGVKREQWLQSFKDRVRGIKL